MTGDGRQKVCTACLRRKPAAEFYPQGKYLSPMCRPCFRAYQAERRRILGEGDKVISPNGKEGFI